MRMMSEATTTEKKIFTLAEVSRSIEAVIRKNFTGKYWVKAEIAKLNYYPKSGHCYPDLVEKKGGKVLAQMRATVWASYYAAITSKFRKATNEELREGMTVLLLAKVEFHPTHGLQLNITDIDADFSMGQMAREKKETIERLLEEGIFANNKKLPFPVLPKRIAIISVQTSKGYHDLMSILENNTGGYKFCHVLFPALLQGDRAVRSIRDKLRNIRHYAEHFDVALIIRGGGGDIGLSCYDNYELAKEVALFPIPVITGIGHSTNETVTEMVANQNKITPTDVAYFLIQHFDNFSAKIRQAHDAVIFCADRMLADERKNLREQIRHFKSNTQRLVEKNKSILKVEVEKMGRCAISFIAGRRRNLREAAYNLRFKPVEKIKNQRMALLNFRKMVELQGKLCLKNESGKLTALETKVRLLEPRNVLKRGYSITFHNGKIVKDAGDLKKSDLIQTELYRGKLESRIESIQPDAG